MILHLVIEYASIRDVFDYLVTHGTSGLNKREVFSLLHCLRQEKKREVKVNLDRRVMVHSNFIASIGQYPPMLVSYKLHVAKCLCA